jgi:hypothetical protein
MKLWWSTLLSFKGEGINVGAGSFWPGRRGGLFWLGSLTFPIFEFQKLTRIFIGLAYQGKNFVFRFIIEYGSLTDFGLPIVVLFL